MRLNSLVNIPDIRRILDVHIASGLIIDDLRDFRILWLYTTSQHLSVNCISVLSVCHFAFAELTQRQHEIWHGYLLVQGDLSSRKIPL